MLLPSDLPSTPWMVVVCLWGALLPGALAYPMGAPDSACSSMVPSHGVSASTSPAPYNVTVSSLTYAPSQSIEVTIQPTQPGGTLRGFMLQARPDSDRDSNTRYGTFAGNSDAKSICSNGASTHTSRSDKSSVTVTWTAPASSQGTIVFRVTVVRVKTDFYTGIYSTPISPATATSPSTTATDTQSSVTSATNHTGSTATNTSLTNTAANEKNTTPTGGATAKRCNILLLFLPLLLLPCAAL